MVACPYCGNTLAVQPDGLDPTGKSAKLADYPTRFSIGATGALHGKPYRILGRVRFQTTRATGTSGTWNSTMAR